MKNKTFFPTYFIQNRWFRLACALALSFGLALTLLLLPLLAGTAAPHADMGFNLPFRPGLVYAAGGLTITKSAPATVEPGGVLTYTITITNNTGADIITGRIIDNLPNEVTCNQGENPLSQPSDWLFYCDNDIAAWRFYSYSSPITSTPVILVYKVHVKQPLTDSNKIVNSDYVITNTTSYIAIGSPITTTINSSGALIITKVDNPDPAKPGDTLVYTLTVTNDPSAAGPAENVIITDTLPASVTFQSAGPVAPAGGLTSRPDASTVVWRVTTPTLLAVGNSLQVTVTVTVNTGLLPNPPIITNTYKTSADNASLVIGTPVGTNLKPGVPSTVIVIADSTNLRVCETTKVTATVVDQGNNPIPNTTLQMLVDLSDFPTPPPDPPIGNAIITSTTIVTSDVNGRVNAYVQGTAVGNVSIGARVWPGGIPTGQTGNINFADPPIPTAIAVTVTPSSVFTGGTAVVTATVSSCRPELLSGQVVTFSIPALYGSVNPATAVTVNGIATTTVTAGNTAGVTMISGEAGSLQSATPFTIVAPTYSLTITKSATPAHGRPVKFGETITYTLRVTHTGNAATMNVLLTDTLPLSVNYVSLISSTNPSGAAINGPAFPGDNVLVLSISKLEAAQTLAVTIGVTVTAAISGAILENSANIRSNTTNLITSNIVVHTVVTTTTGSGNVYLPIILRNSP